MGGKGVLYPAPPMTQPRTTHFLFGRPIPAGITNAETLARPDKLGFSFSWTTKEGKHQMEVEGRWDEKTVAAVLVAMRMTCS